MTAALHGVRSLAMRSSAKRPGWPRVFAATAAIGLVLAAPAAANHYPGYWFFRGYLPLSNGYPAVSFPVNTCCSKVNVIRLSHECNTHPMLFVWILWTGSWDTVETRSCDDNIPGIINGYQGTRGYTRGGCENPLWYGDWIWTNCRVDTSI